jgi:diguanylate cyclase (GGDEF)-like protein/PAS domain S-box-containing protein
MVDTPTKPVRLGPEAYEAIYRNSIDGVLFTAPDGRVLAANPAAQAILRLSEEEICALGRPGLAVTEDERWAPALEERERVGHARAELRMRRGDDTEFVADISSAIFFDSSGRGRACVIFRDATERVRMLTDLEERTRELDELAQVDELTALRNRRGFVSAGLQQLEFADRDDAECQLLFVDIDRMKEINDTYGHAVGDDALRLVASTLRANTRAVDVTGRFGGDEFVALLYNTDVASARNVAKRITDDLLSASAMIDTSMLTASIGIASRPPSSTRSLGDLIVEADTRMYESKGSDRGGMSTSVDEDQAD